MAIFDKVRANRIKMRVKNPDNTFSEIIPITDSASVVVDNENEVYLDTKLADIDTHMTSVNEYISSVLEGPSTTYIHPYTGYKIYDIDAGDGYSYMAIGNVMQSFTHTGSIQEIIQNNSPTTAITNRYSERTMSTITHTTSTTGYAAVKHIGYNTTIYAESYSITCVNYANKIIKGKNVFSIASGSEGKISGIDVMLPDDYTGSTNDYVYAVCIGILGGGDNYATLGIIRFTPFNTNAQSSFSSTRLQTTTTNVPSAVKVAGSKIYIGYSAGDGTYIDLFNYNTSNLNLTTSTKYKISSSNLDIIDIEPINGGNSLLVAYNEDSTPNIIRLDYNSTSNTFTLNSTDSYTAYSNGTICGMIKDIHENIYIVYSDGKLIRYDLSYNNLWEYKWGINSIPTSLAIDDEMNYIVIGAENGQFETLKVNLIESTAMTVSVLDSRTMSLQSEILSIEEGSLIEKIEVCQLNGDIELTGDITGTTTLTADNTCLLDPDSGHTGNHRIVLDTNLNVDATIDKDISDTDADYQVINKKYVDSAIKDIPVEVAVSSSEPTNLSVGGVWYKLSE